MTKSITTGIHYTFMQEDDCKDGFYVDVTEPLYVNIRTNQTDDGYCPKSVRIRMGDKKK